jgi:hypothetical protein
MDWPLGAARASTSGPRTNQGPLLPQALRAPRPPSGSGRLRGASGFADGRVLPLPTGPSPALPRSRAPVEVWGVAPTSASAGVQLEATAPLYGAVPCPWWSGPRPQSLPVRRRRVSPEPAAIKRPCEPSHDHQPLGQLLVRRQLAIAPLPRRSRAHGGHCRRPPERRSPAVPPPKTRRPSAPRRARGPPRPLPDRPRRRPGRNSSGAAPVGLEGHIAR